MNEELNDIYFSDPMQIISLFLQEGLLKLTGPEDWVCDLSPEYSVWPINSRDVRRPLSSLKIGDYIHCPRYPTTRSAIPIIGMNGKPYGFVCNECDAICTTTDLGMPYDLPVDGEAMVDA
ncbi:hypothetical protein [Paraburkholderia sp. ZP32-5]|uniref:hypothetical protein n=1 Tax=Paraburkholderia sp. ZP32-5 TaxID=2883245 RepID=UPI001F1AB515|nr:hypothetical protein [Paraburkholderia sp. ZP32-5]